MHVYRRLIDVRHLVCLYWRAEAMNVGDEEGEDDGLGSGSISDVDDLDDYINQLKAGSICCRHPSISSRPR
eukprot:1162095-Pelagomonas_calceolata.AAC.4